MFRYGTRLYFRISLVLFFRSSRERIFGPRFNVGIHTKSSSRSWTNSFSKDKTFFKSLPKGVSLFSSTGFSPSRSKLLNHARLFSTDRSIFPWNFVRTFQILGRFRYLATRLIFSHGRNAVVSTNSINENYRILNFFPSLRPKLVFVNFKIAITRSRRNHFEMLPQITGVVYGRRTDNKRDVPREMEDKSLLCGLFLT